jgi:hypothetical protein
MGDRALRTLTGERDRDRDRDLTGEHARTERLVRRTRTGLGDPERATRARGSDRSWLGAPHC